MLQRTKTGIALYLSDLSKKKKAISAYKATVTRQQKKLSNKLTMENKDYIYQVVATKVSLTVTMVLASNQTIVCKLTKTYTVGDDINVNIISRVTAHQLEDIAYIAKIVIGFANISKPPSRKTINTSDYMTKIKDELSYVICEKDFITKKVFKERFDYIKPVIELIEGNVTTPSQTHHLDMLIDKVSFVFDQYGILFENGTHLAVEKSNIQLLFLQKTVFNKKFGWL